MHKPFEQFIANRPSLNLLDAKSPVAGRPILASLMFAIKQMQLAQLFVVDKISQTLGRIKT
jgi:hypothetical protein